jgi:hypothetical protein
MMPAEGAEAGFRREQDASDENRIPPSPFFVLLHEVIAQLDRASDCGSEGRRFESS